MLRVTALEKIEAALANLLQPDQPLLVGVSGGPDSVVLLDALVRLGYRPHVGHLNHQLRGAASDADAEFVRQLAAQHSVPVTIAAAHVAPAEDACRQARHAFFEQVAGSTGIHTLVLAHTADDQVETFLLRLLRGAGPTGLTGIRPDRLLGALRVIRPLLNVSRAEVLEYLQAHGLECRQDASNSDRRFARNRIRHELLPLLEQQYNPQIREVLRRTAEILRDEDQVFSEQVAKYQHTATVSVSELLQLPVALQRRALRAWLGTVSFEEVEAIRQLAAAGSPSGAVAALVHREYDELHKTQHRPELTPVLRRWPLNMDGETKIEQFCLTIICHFERHETAASRLSANGKSQLAQQEILRQAQGDTKNNERFDAEALGAAPFLRTWQEGDRFQPLGMTCEKKIQDFFVDEKVPRRQRSQVPLLCAHDGRIAWVVGYRLAEPFKVTAVTKRVLRIQRVGG